MTANTSDYYLQNCPESCFLDFVSHVKSYRIKFNFDESKAESLQVFNLIHRNAVATNVLGQDVDYRPVKLGKFFATQCSICQSSLAKKAPHFCKLCGTWVCKEHCSHKSDLPWKKGDFLICQTCFNFKNRKT